MAVLIALAGMGRVVLTVVGTVPLAALEAARALRNTPHLPQRDPLGDLRTRELRN